MWTQEEKTETVDLRRIVKDQTLQVRNKLDRQHVERLRGALKSGAELPPIRIAVVGGLALLVDGFHRVEAMESLGHETAAAIVVERSSRADAIWMAARANLAHGLALKKPELKNVFRAYIAAKRHRVGKSGLKSYVEMAKELGIPRTTLMSWMRRMYPAIAEELSGQNTSGLGVGERREPTPPAIKDAEAALKHLRGAFQGTSKETERAAMRAMVEAVLKDMDDATDWRSKPEENDLPF